ncbi:Gifsy-1 prophage protein [Leclercia adecarboxylata]|nr:Gifsy-1 prophage protein [Leclercia adecarboxylata]KMN64140.1 Gifsy-1 prophage protein [Leclercia sp. LK8]
MVEFVYNELNTLRKGTALGSVWESNMFTIITNADRMAAAAADTHLNHVNVEGKSGVVNLVVSVKNDPINMLRPDNFSQCVILNNLHVPQGALVTDIDNYNKGLQLRINLEYNPKGSIVFLLGSPEALDANESLSLPIFSHVLTQKLLNISNSKLCELSVKSNGYV